MKKLGKISFIVLLAVTRAVAVLHSDFNPMGFGPMHEGMMGRGFMGGEMMGSMVCGFARGVSLGWISEELDLSEKQIEKIRQGNKDIQRENIELLNKTQLLFYDLNEEMKSKEINKEKVNNIIDEYTSAQNQIMKNRLRMVENIKKNLNDKQLKDFENLDWTDCHYGNMMEYYER